MAEKKIVSADGKGRTLLQQLLGLNKKEMTPLELQVHNPLKAKVGCSVTFQHVLFVPNLNYFIEAIRVLETKIGTKIFHTTDYLLKGTSLDESKPVRIILRLTPDDEVPEIGHRICLLHNYMEFGWPEAEQMDFHDGILMHQDGIFDVNYDDEGNQLDEPMRYWRIGDDRMDAPADEEGVVHKLGVTLDPYHSKVTTLKDVDASGEVDDDELERSKLTWWDYHRQTIDLDTELTYVQKLIVEMDEDTRSFTLFRGQDIEPFQASII